MYLCVWSVRWTSLVDLCGRHCTSDSRGGMDGSGRYCPLVQLHVIDADDWSTGQL